MFSFVELNPGSKQEPWSFATTGIAGMSRPSDASRQRSRKSSPTITLWPVDGSLTNILSQAFVLSFLILWYVNYFVLCGFVFVAKHFVLSFLTLWYVNYFVLCAFVFFGFETYCQETCFGPCSTRWWAGGEWWGEREEGAFSFSHTHSTSWRATSSRHTTSFKISSFSRLFKISSFSRLFKISSFSRLISSFSRLIGASRSCDASWKMVFKVCRGLLFFFSKFVMFLEAFVFLEHEFLAELWCLLCIQVGAHGRRWSQCQSTTADYGGVGCEGRPFHGSALLEVPAWTMELQEYLAKIWNFYFLLTLKSRVSNFWSTCWGRCLLPFFFKLLPFRSQWVFGSVDQEGQGSRRQCKRLSRLLRSSRWVTVQVFLVGGQRLIHV